METDIKIGEVQFGRELTGNVFFLLCGSQTNYGNKIKHSAYVHLAADWPFWDWTQMQE